MMASDHLWLRPPSNLTLPGRDVHVWSVSLEQPVAHLHQLRQLLSNDEQDRAERFHFERDRRRSIVVHGTLRTILGRYLDIEPGRLQFRCGPHGKPYLTQELDHGALQFNLAHSNEVAVYAFTCGRQIGIDVEYIRPIPDVEQIAVRFFSAGENAALCALPESLRLETFFNCWTRKEAYIKAIGEGLSHPLDQFQVSLAPGEAARLLWVEGSPEKVGRWSLTALSPAPGYVAALAVEGFDYHLKCWECVL
jgi:4'-phosphopantetheinyl transferase